MSFAVGLRYNKGLGGAAVYARLVYGPGFWDFSAHDASAVETTGCKVFLTEIQDNSPDTSWYYADITIPHGGPFPIEIMCDGINVGNDITPASVIPTASTSTTSRSLTREQFAIKVLSVLGVYDRTTPEPEDQQNVLDAYDGVYQQLKDDGLVTWTQGAGEGIPVRFANSLVDLVAASGVLLGTYPQEVNKSQRLMLMAQAAMKQIRRQLTGMQPTETVAAEYF